MGTYTIGEAADAAGVTTRAVRLYETKGLVPPPERTPSGYRVFTHTHVEALAFVRRGRSLGLSLDAIAEIMDISASGQPCCDRTKDLLTQRLGEIDAAIADLQQLRQAISRAQDVTADQASGNLCVLIEQASDPTFADRSADPS